VCKQEDAFAVADAPYLLGLDIGTSTLKTGLFTADGREIATVSDEYLVLPDGQEAIDVAPEVFWHGVCRVIRAVIERTEARRERIVALSMSSHAETLVFLDKSGRSVRPAIFTNDVRAGSEAAELAREFDPLWLLEHTGQPDAVALLPACKILWLRRHEPEAFARIAHYLLPSDYIGYQLTGTIAGHDTMWLSSLMLDVRQRDWLSPVLQRVGVRREQLPQLLPSGTVIGRVRDEAAAVTGLQVGTPVVMGAMDQMCAALAAGNIRPGIVTESTGSVLALLATTGRPIFDPVTKIGCYTHAVPGAYCLVPWNPTGGLVLKWFKDRFAQTEQQQSEISGKSAYELLCDAAAAVAPGCDGLVMIPHLQGMLFPEIVPAARGVYFGFSLGHGKAHFTRAILEAIAFMLRDGLDALKGLGVDIQQVAVLGGGGRSRLWSQIKADVCQSPLVVPAVTEAALQGAAILAAVGAGLHAGIPDAAAAMAGPADRIEPNPDLAQVYDAAYQRYRALFKQLRALFG
jgi:xylulokinase